MVAYFFILLVILGISGIEQKILKQNGIWLSSLILIIFASIRDYTVGTDTVNYVNKFIIGYRINFEYEHNYYVEPVFQIIEYLIYQLTDNYFWLFFVCFMIIIPCNLLFFKKYSVDYKLSVFIFVAYGLYTFSFNTLRNGIAIAIIVWGFKFFLEEKTFKYIFVCLLATLFHISALAMILFYFLVIINVKFIYKLCFVLLLSFFLSDFVIDFMATSNSRYEIYTEKIYENKGSFIFIFYLSCFVIFTYFKINLFKEDMLYRKLYQFYGLGIVFLIPIVISDLHPSGPQRFLYYFSWVICILFPMIFSKLKSTGIKSLFYVFSLIAFYLVLDKFGGIVPYKINSIFEIIL
ncbi:EpsG family protein [Glaesserella parasuis]|uniref:EpsG family protein n=1 Tax=Glaesserella parasuis TaxID=738 RepID=T1RQ81_GLAPU|nr:EpsG family protein [Glaesserella parasuis]AGM38880.1 hypothetical protein [Glaesserella parasuis]EQA11289.1 putative membrane protein [Glaesserella parasuis 84-15995]MCT8824064.1 EpsG family protein [Glaesserella parasuis]MDO9664119.1 EpsG family protein [Glaesserella parasuis]MDP0097900.1 EpsG family protein [Glaesserella parasuis]